MHAVPYYLAYNCSRSLHALILLTHHIMAIPPPTQFNAIRWTQVIPPHARAWNDLKRSVGLLLAHAGYYYPPASTLANKIILPPEVTILTETLLGSPPRTELKWTILEPPEFTTTPYAWYFRAAPPTENRWQYVYSVFTPPPDGPPKRKYRITWPSGWMLLAPAYHKPTTTYTQTIGGHFTVWSLRLSPNQADIEDLPLAPPWHRADFP